MTEHSGTRVFDGYISHVIHAFKVGLSKFAGSCEVAVVANLSGSIYLYDPDNLFESMKISQLCTPEELEKVGLQEGIIQQKSSSRRDPVQSVWFARLHPSVDCDELVLKWLTGIANIVNSTWHLSLVAKRPTIFAIECIQYMVLDVIANQVSSSHASQPKGEENDNDYPIRGVLDCLQRLCRAVEEGHSPTGAITFIEPSAVPSYTFTNRILLSNAKHVCKLLSLAAKSGELLSDGTYLTGVSTAAADSYVLKAIFQDGSAQIICKGKLVCRIISGEFRSPVVSPARILDSQLGDEVDPKAKAIIAAIAENAIKMRFGCLIVLDNEDKLGTLSGHYLDKATDAIDLVTGMAKVDGAIVISKHGLVKAFGCILDGAALDDEILSRGSRFNSARRFSNHHKHDGATAVVVSADGPVTLFQNGAEIYADPWSKKIKRIDDYDQQITGIALKNYTFLDQLTKAQN